VAPLEEENLELAALIALHAGLERQGPGDADFSRSLLELLPALPAAPRIADLGCGAGGAALMLAEHFQMPVKAVDLHPTFLEDLKLLAARRGLGHLIEPVHADMGNLGWPEGCLDLLWSEGAAYHLTFTGALHTWRPLLAPGGVAVISELSWFSDKRPDDALAFWGAGYPTMGSEAENMAHARAAGYEVIEVVRLPSQAWWDNYYGPLMARMEQVRPTADTAMSAVLEGTQVEMDLFRVYSDAYGYSFYLLQAV